MSIIRSAPRRRVLAGLAGVVIVAAFVAVAAPAEAAAPKPAKLTVSPASYQFGSVVVGASSAGQSITVTNTGQSPSGVLAVAVTGSTGGDFTLDANGCTGALAAGSACTVTMHFAPSATGVRTASLSVSGTPGGAVSTALKGTGVAAKLAISPTSHGYGSIALGSSSGGQTITITNSGQGVSGPVAVSLGGTDAGDFTVGADTCTGVLAAGASCSVSVVFTPAAAGARSATLTATGTPGGTVTAKLTGTGAARANLTVAPAVFDFGPVPPGGSSPVQVFTVTNTGVAAAGKLAVAAAGAGFVLDASTCTGVKLAAGATCTITAHFTPAATGAATGSLSATASPGGTATAVLQGAGATAAALSIDPAAFDFGPVQLGADSAAHTFTVTNAGQTPSGVVAVASSTGAFVIEATTCGAALAGGATCTVTAHFTPAAGGAATAGLTATASPGGTASSSLQGDGRTPAQLSIDPTSYDFGAVEVGTMASKTFTVTNTGQTPSGPLTARVNGSYPGVYYFSVSGNTCTGTLAGGASCAVTVSFYASDIRFAYANLSVAGDPGGTVFATFAAQPFRPASLSTSTGTLDYGNVVVGTTTGTQTVTVTNSGERDSGPVGVAVTGTNAADFAIGTDTCAGSPLPAGGSCTVSVSFSPGATGGRGAALQVSASPGGGRDVSLAGTGVNVLMVNQSEHDFGDSVQGTKPTTDFVLTNYGATALGSFVLSSTNATDFPVTANTCTGATVHTGESCTVTVQFDAAFAGAHAATLGVSFTDTAGTVRGLTLQVNGSAHFAQPDLATTLTVTSQGYFQGTVLITVTNMGSTPSVAGTTTVTVHPVQAFSMQSGAGSDCTASFSGNDSVFTCPVPAIPVGGTFTRVVTVKNLSNQAPRYVQVSATTVMPGDTNGSNDRGYAMLTFN